MRGGESSADGTSLGDGRFCGRGVALDEVDSTNRWLLENMVATGADRDGWSRCAARRQSAGHGRHGRTWWSDAGSLTFSVGRSVAARAPGEPAPLPQPVLAVAMAGGLAECIESMLPGARACGFGVKWPNDLLWGDAKLAGLLLESRVVAPPGAIARRVTVAGLGVNLAGADALQARQQVVSQSAALSRPMTDVAALAQAAGRVSPPTSVWLEVLSARTQRVWRDVEAGRAAPWLDAWEHFDVLRGAELLVEAGRAQALGLDRASGGLRVLHAGGERVIHSGEVFRFAGSPCGDVSVTP